MTYNTEPTVNLSAVTIAKTEALRSHVLITKMTCTTYAKKKKRQQRRHVNIIWPPVWLLAYLISSSQRKGLPLQHAKTSRKGRESSHQSKKTHSNNAAIAMSGLDMLKIY